MGKIELDPKIMKTMDSWGNNYNSDVGCGHDTDDDKVSKEIDSVDVTLNRPAAMDASHAKPSNKNPGFDKSFWAKAEPQGDTTGHGKLSRRLKDYM